MMAGHSAASRALAANIGSTKPRVLERSGIDRIEADASRQLALRSPRRIAAFRLGLAHG
jgi:hypothetical protein